MTGRFSRRKWGWYLTLIDRGFFKVKILRFHKGCKLSTQYHTYRNELWLFLTGEHAGAWKVIKKGEVHTYTASKSTYVLEIQYGEKCEEGDIVRI